MDDIEPVKSTYKFMGTLKKLKFISTETYIHATMNNKVVKLCYPYGICPR